MAVILCQQAHIDSLMKPEHDEAFIENLQATSQKHGKPNTFSLYVALMLHALLFAGMTAANLQQVKVVGKYSTKEPELKL